MPREAAPKHGFVYFIRSGETDFYKIGLSIKHPTHRLKELQTGNPEELELIGFITSGDVNKTERYTHNEYAKYHYRGEWFEIPWQVLYPQFPKYFYHLTDEYEAEQEAKRLRQEQLDKRSLIAWIAFIFIVITAISSMYIAGQAEYSKKFPKLDFNQTATQTVKNHNAVIDAEVFLLDNDSGAGFADITCSDQSNHQIDFESISSLIQVCVKDR